MEKYWRKHFTKHKRSRWILLPLLLLFLMFSGCAASKQKEVPEEQEIITVNIPEGSTKLYYMNEARTKVINKGITLSHGTVEEQVSDLLTILEEELWTEDEKALITDGNPIREFKVDENGLLSLRFTADYNSVSITCKKHGPLALASDTCVLSSLCFNR